MSAVRMTNLVKRFGNVVAVDGVTVEAEAGQLTTLLGPSGCGKTTMLRMIAGLESPDAGEIRIGDRVVASRARGIDIPAEKRGIGMVFQSYALWPHKNVFENVAYPLRIRRRGRAEIESRVGEVLALLGLQGLERRYPGQLSGGQQQRVALGRAIAYGPTLLLLDEPLANLDARVRESVRFDLKELQRRTGLTTVYVTHDQAEAMVLSDKIVVMADGKAVQEGTPLDIYQRPATRFVAEFVGQSNFIGGTLRSREGGHGVVALDNGGSLRVPYTAALAADARVLLCIRPEDFELLAAPPADHGESANALEAVIEARAFLGNIVNYWVESKGWRFRVQADVAFELEHRESNRLFLRVREDQVKVLVQSSTGRRT